MSDKDSLGDRMKAYESVPKSRLVPHVPVLARLDGKAFHSYTAAAEFERPYDSRLHRAMWETARYLCEHVQGCRIAYVQSDEITLLLTQRGERSQAWFDYEIQKMCSVAASWAGVAFWRALQYAGVCTPSSMLPAFDARFWNVPAHEVVNALIWRQQDAVRNSIQMLGQSKFSHKQLHEKACPQIQEMLFAEHGINWNDCPTPQKRGACIVRELYEVDPPPEARNLAPGEKVVRSRWVVDENIPIFVQDRDYIARHLVSDEARATS